MSDRREQHLLVPAHDVGAQATTEPRDVPQPTGLICITVENVEWALSKFVKPNTMRAMIERMRKKSQLSRLDETNS